MGRCIPVYNLLLKRIKRLEDLTERLEQEIQSIYNSCLCLTKDLGPGGMNCEPPACEDCQQFDCVCETEEEDKENHELH